MTGTRKFTIASRMTWMTFALVLVILVVAWAGNSDDGETLRVGIQQVSQTWWKALGAVGLWFGLSNAAVHVARARNGGNG